MAIHFIKYKSLLPKNALFQATKKTAQWFWRKSRKRKKSADIQTDGMTDAGQKVIRRAHLSFQLRRSNKMFKKKKEARKH